MEIGNWKYWVTGLVLASASALLRFWAFAQTPFANGWDSYFYLVQIKSLEDTGRMHSPEASLIYPYLRFFYWLTGDYVVALKAGTAVLCGAWTLVVWWFASKTTLTGGVLGAWTVFSPQLTYFAAQYPKNLLGLVLLVAFIASLNRPRTFSFTKPEKSWVLPIFFLASNYFAHRFTFVLAVIYFVFWLMLRVGSGYFKKAIFTKLLLWLAAATGVFLVASRLFLGLFHFIDLSRLNGAFRWPPQFAPWSFVTQFGLERISGWWLVEVMLVTGFCLLVTGYWLKAVTCRLLVRPKRVNLQSTIDNRQSAINASHSALPLFGICTLLLFPFVEWSFTGFAWRFFLVFILLTPLLVIDFQIGIRKRSGLVFAAIALCCSCFSWKSYDPKIHDPDYARFQAITTRTQQVLKEKKIELVIAHNALAEFFTFTTGIDAMPWLPEYEVDSSGLWRIATGVRLETLRYFAGTDGATSIMTLGYQYFLMPEKVWQTAIRRAELENDEEFLAETRSWSNPSRIRPNWLLHRKRTY